MIRYLEEHPHRDNPEAAFWITARGERLAYQGMYKLIKRIGWKALRRNVYPHGFRHTAATNEARLFTDREMMIRYGRKRSDMVGVYAHLSARDVDDKDMMLHGLKPAGRNGSETCSKS